MICSYCGGKLKKVIAHRGGPSSPLGIETAAGYLCKSARWYEPSHHKIIVPGSMSPIGDMTFVALHWLLLLIPFTGLYFLFRGKI